MSEQLIYALSTLGELGLAKFNDIFKRLYLPEDDKDYDYNMRHQTIRYLESLGYCEFDYDQRRVFMCPPALVLLPSFGLPKALLTGARTPKFIASIKKSVKDRKNKVVFNRCKQKNADVNLPDATVIEAISFEVVKEIANENNISLGDERPSAWDLANQSVSIDDIEATLRFENNAEINWERKDFNSQRLGFSDRHLSEEYRLSQYINPINRQRKHWIWNGGKAADVNRDWGRYIVLKKLGKQILFYKKEAQELRVPLWVPLPCLLARAVTLCSGMAPIIEKNPLSGDIPDGCLMQIYSDVPVEISRIICKKIGQKVFNSQ